MALLHVGIIIILSMVLGRSARVIEKHIERIGRSCGVGNFTLSFVFLGLATSMPEISVAVFSAVHGTPALSLGNLIGANVVVLSLLTGLAAVLAGKLTTSSFQRHHIFPFFLGIVGLPGVVVLDGMVTRAEGIALILAHVLFLGHFAKHGGETDMKKAAVCHPGPDVAKALGATAVLLLSSYFLVNSALALADTLGLAPLVIGLLMLSLGTNLPELTFVLTQAKGRGASVVLGDLFGNALVNTPTLGLLALISPFTIERHAQALVATAMMAILLSIFAVFMLTGNKITRKEGFALIGLYAFFLLNQLDLIALT